MTQVSTIQLGVAMAKTGSEERTEMPRNENQLTTTAKSFHFHFYFQFPVSISFLFPAFPYASSCQYIQHVYTGN